MNQAFELSQTESTRNITDEEETDDNRSDSEEVDVVALPPQSKIAYTVDIANLLVCEISSYLHDRPNVFLAIAIETK